MNTKPADKLPGQWIVDLRIALGMTVRTFFNELHISSTTYYRVRSGYSADLEVYSRVLGYAWEYVEPESFHRVSDEFVGYIIDRIKFKKQKNNKK